MLIDGGVYDGRGGSVEGTVDLGAENGKAYGGSGSDTIIGGWGDDYIDGGEGADRMIGGTWDDTFVVDGALDEVVEISGEGKDTVLAHTSYALNEAASVEVLKAFDLSATTSINLTGNDGSNSIIGNGGPMSSKVREVQIRSMVGRATIPSPAATVMTLLKAAQV